MYEKIVQGKKVSVEAENGKWRGIKELGLKF